MLSKPLNHLKRRSHAELLFRLRSGIEHNHNNFNTKNLNAGFIFKKVLREFFLFCADCKGQRRIFNGRGA